MKIGTYRRITDEVQAMQVDTMDYDGLCDIVGWINGRAVDDEERMDVVMRQMTSAPETRLPVISFVNERHEECYLYNTDWVVRQTNGKFFRVPNDAFHTMFEMVWVTS